MPVLRPQPEADAVVVLTGGYERITRAIQVAATTGLPLVISGGVSAEDVQAMNRAGLQEYLHEGTSSDTESNAAFLRCTAQQKGWKSVILVTDAFHLPRAQAWLWWYGVPSTGIAAPLSFYAGEPDVAQQTIVRNRIRHEAAGMAELAWKVLTRRRVKCQDAPVRLLSLPLLTG